MSSKILSFLLSIVALFSGLAISDNSDAVRYRNLPYGLSARRQTLDLNIPKSVKGDANVIVFIHGGTWCAGSKNDFEASVEKFSGKGYVSAAVNYRFCGFPDYISVEDILDDISAALSKIKEKAAEHGVKLRGVMFEGVSAGAHLSLLYAYKKAGEAPLKPVAVVAKSPATDFTDMTLYDGSLHELNPDEWSISKSEWCRHLSSMTGKLITKRNLEKKTEILYDISPIKYVNKSSVPTILVHGTKDTVLPYSNSVNLEKKLKKCGVEHEFITFKNSGHSLSGSPKDSEEFSKAYNKYIKKYLNV